MGRFKQVAPIFPVNDLDVSLAHYARLGFRTRKYGRDTYGFAETDESRFISAS